MRQYIDLDHDVLLAHSTAGQLGFWLVVNPGEPIGAVCGTYVRGVSRYVMVRRCGGMHALRHAEPRDYAWPAQRREDSSVVQQ